MQRRSFLTLMVAAVPALAIEPDAESVRGELQSGHIRKKDGQIVELSGDEPTMLVIHDDRLVGKELEVHGHTKAPGQFAIDKIHTRSLFVYVNGNKRMITYWCDVCYIRTFAPGPCWCCQDPTRLDLVDPDKVSS